MAAAILVIVFGLGDRVVNVDSRHFQLTLFEHIDKAVNACGSFLGDTVNIVQNLRILMVGHRSQVATIVQQHVAIPGLAIFKDCLLDTPFGFFLSLAFPSVNRNAGSGHGRGSMILRGEDVAG